MTRIDPVWATVAELSRAFGEGTLSPVDVVDTLLERIRKRDPVLHAFIAVYEADARLAAEATAGAFLLRACLDFPSSVEGGLPPDVPRRSLEASSTGTTLESSSWRPGSR